MSNTYFMGIDTGTNSTKGVIIDENCQIVSTHSTEHYMTNPLPNYFEHDAAKDWWGDFCLVSKALIKKSNINPIEIKSIGLSALGADCLPVDKQCKPLRKAILYGIDARATEEIDELTKMYGKKQIIEWFGRDLCSSDVMPKILWVRKNEPEIFKKTHKFLTGSSFLTAKLTGNYVVDRFLGLASFNPLYDKKTWKPDPILCKPICDPAQLASVQEATDIAGYITHEAAIETGLFEGTPVITGTDDSGAEAISSGVVKPGKMMIQFGSSIYMILCTKNIVNDHRLWREEFIIPGLYDISAGTNTAGNLTKWYIDNFFSNIESSKSTGNINPYEAMMVGVDQISVGSDGLITLPYFAGERTPINDPKAKGMIFGLTLSHTLPHLYRSALEGIGYSINQQLRIIESHKEVEIDTIYAVGGGVINDEWMQIVSDIIGKAITIPSVTIGASYGDAMMAAIGIRHPGFENFESLNRYITHEKKYIPNAENHKKYHFYQTIYDSLYISTKELAHKISEFN